MSQPRLRALLAGEAPALAALHARCFPADPWSAQALAELLAQPGCQALLALADKEGPVGFLLLRVAADEAEILSLGVAPEWRRRGLAGRLLQAALAPLLGLGLRRCFLEVAAGNAAALALYRGLGFRQVGRRRHYYRDGGDALVLRLSVAGELRNSAGDASINADKNRDKAK